MIRTTCVPNLVTISVIEMVVTKEFVRHVSEIHPKIVCQLCCLFSQKFMHSTWSTYETLKDYTVSSIWSIAINCISLESSDSSLSCGVHIPKMKNCYMRLKLKEQVTYKNSHDFFFHDGNRIRNKIII